MEPMEFSAKTGRQLKAGSRLVADMYYHPADTPQIDQTSIGLYFTKGNKVDKELVNLWVQNPTFKIPAGNSNLAARSTYTFPQDSYIINMLPHMHYRGKDLTYTARFPDGRKEKLLSVSNYDFNWQTGYELAEPLYVPKGTRIDCVAHWDNSADNPANPDPTRDVTFGNESNDEMMIGFIDYIVKDGVHPPSAGELMSIIATDLAVKTPGDIYISDVIDEEDGDVQHAVSYLPRNGSDRKLHLDLNGTMFEAPLTELVWAENHFTCVLKAFGQVMDYERDIDPVTGDINGYVQDRDQKGNGGSVRGTRVQ